MAVDGEFDPDPAVCIAISPLRRADLAMGNPAPWSFHALTAPPKETPNGCELGFLDGGAELALAQGLIFGDGEPFVLFGG